ncbi:hypothetical protein [Streptomyces chartreusis]|uniref:hypothetical protein n=1 Tax=Streptomyces chartreusis TaxID=1969 RepID=UPI0036668B7B
MLGSPSAPVPQSRIGNAAARIGLEDVVQVVVIVLAVWAHAYDQAVSEEGGTGEEAEGESP